MQLYYGVDGKPEPAFSKLPIVITFLQINFGLWHVSAPPTVIICVSKRVGCMVHSTYLMLVLVCTW